jgi:sigma-E factor negative regulatory protein RseC
VIVEPATVLRVTDEAAWVSCHAQTGCRRCAEGRGCGGDVLGRLLGDRLREVRVRTGDLALCQGDEVLIGVDERTLLGASFVMYLLPLLAMLAGGLCAAGLWPASGEPGVMLGAGGGFVAGLACARRYGRSRRADARFEPRVIARLPSTAARQALAER